MSASQNDLTLGRPAGGGAIGVGNSPETNRETRLIYIGLAIVGVLVLIMVFFLTRGSGVQTVGVKSDTRYDFTYRDPNTIISRTNRIIVDADVFVKLTAHKDRPDTIAIDTASRTTSPNATFTWTLIPQLGTDGPTQLAGEFYYQGTIYKACEAIIGSPSNFPPPLNRLYAEQYYPIDNTTGRYHTPHQVDPAPFVNFMRTTIADTAHFTGDGSLPTRQIRQLAGELIPYCLAP